MVLIGLTGGVGMGKSTAAGILQSGGLTVIDTDIIARELVQPGQEALAQIQAAFDPEVIDASGNLRRDVVAQRVFAAPGERLRLEAILHPRIRDEWQRRVEKCRAANAAGAVVVIPLLFETAAAPLFTATICVACSAESQKQRLLMRGWDLGQIQQRVAAQWSTEKKMTASTFVVWSEGSIEIHRQQLVRILNALKLPASL